MRLATSMRRSALAFNPQPGTDPAARLDARLSDGVYIDRADSHRVGPRSSPVEHCWSKAGIVLARVGTGGDCMICKRVWSASVAATIVFALTAPLHSQPPDTHRGRDWDCPNPPGWTLTREQIEAIRNGPGSRDLCNADLRPALPTIYDSVEDIEGIKTVRFWPGQETGLVQLRSLFQKGGLRDLEREATYAIEFNTTRHLFSEMTPSAIVEGAFRLVFFEWPSDYGLYPGRSLLIIIAIWALIIPAYTWSIWRAPLGRNPSSGIYRVWSSDRIEFSRNEPRIEGSAKVERMQRRGLAAVGAAAYFSLLSAFYIGWRELNVGAWIARIQPKEYEMRATGWVRVAAGVQSLLSVYLIALWVLTYFGRPFE